MLRMVPKRIFRRKAIKLLTLIVLLFPFLRMFSYKLISSSKTHNQHQTINLEIKTKHEESYKHVCFESNTSKRRIRYHTASSHGDNPDKVAYITPDVQISVYGSKQEDSDGHIGLFPVTFKSGNIPRSHIIHQSKVALFTPIMRIHNIYHEFEQFLFPVYRMLRVSNRLEVSADLNEVFYVETRFFRNPDKAEIHFSNSSTFTQGNKKIILDSLLLAMPVKNYIHYNKAEVNTCYETAIFETDLFRPTQRAISTTTRQVQRREMARHLINAMNIKTNSCIKSDKPKITIINRTSNRRILNLEEILERLESEGIKNIDVVKMEEMSIKDQVQTMLCTDILIGVHGAALHWAFFLPKGRVLLEIAWPDLLWGFFYDKQFKNDKHLNVMTFNVPPEDVFSSLAPFVDRANKKNKRKLTRKEIKKAANGKPGDSLVMNQYREADIVINAGSFVKTVKKCISKVKIDSKLP